MKKVLLLFLCIAAASGSVLLSACSGDSGLKKLTDLRAYKNLKQDPNKIIVYYSDAQQANFEVTDTETLERITSPLFNDVRLKRASTAPGRVIMVRLPYAMLTVIMLSSDCTELRTGVSCTTMPMMRRFFFLLKRLRKNGANLNLYRNINRRFH
jgi:hypothetical protein